MQRFSYHHIRRSFIAFLSWAAVLWLTVGSAAYAARPTAEELLPNDTVVYFAVADSRELVEHFNETSIGQMLRDPQLKPLADRVYEAAAKAASRVEETLGVSIEELAALPQGEITLAVVPIEGKPPAVIVLFDAGEQAAVMQKLLDRGAEVAAERGLERHEETILETKVVRFAPDGDANRQVMYGEKEGTFILATNLEAIRGVLERWTGAKEGSLIGNESYAAIMSRCGNSAGEEPQIAWFVDPINLVKSVAANNPGAAVGLAVLPVLGLDGLMGVGGTVSLAVEPFDSVMHIHLLLDTPRAGVIETLALKTGETKPEAWVPGDAVTYMTVTWDFEKSYREVGKLVDGFQGDGAFATQVQRGLDRFELNFETDILPAFTGRVSTFSWIEPPVRLTSQAMVIGLELKDAKAFSGTLDKIMANSDDRFETKTFGQTSYWTLKQTEDEVPAAEGEAAPQEGDGPRRRGPRFRPFRGASIAIVGDYVLIADRPGVLEQAILSTANPTKSFGESVEFKLISSKIMRQAGEVRPGMLMIQRNDESLRFAYDLATSEATRERLKRGAEGNEFFRDLDQALNDNPLPPFAVLQKYFAPAGAFVTNEETGFHYMTFTLQRKAE